MLLQGTALESSTRFGPLNAEQQLQARLCLACCGLTCMGILPHCSQCSAGTHMYADTGMFSDQETPPHRQTL